MTTDAHASPASSSIRSIILVHGAFVDCSGWAGVHNILTSKGYNVTIVQNPTASLADDVALTRRTIVAQGEPVVLVGHSYAASSSVKLATTPW